ncbi:MAG: poly-gamma-glutamate hydrolase family protein [Anaerolineae bacterium]
MREPIIKGSYRSFVELTAHEQVGEDYREIVRDRDSAIVVLAPHGGGIERGTSELAAAIAGDELSLYCFEGLKREANDVLHIASTCFDAPRCVALVARAQIAVSVHGCRGDETVVYVGGRHTSLKERLIVRLRHAGFQARNDATHHPGVFKANICNRGRLQRGIQLELPRGLRERLFVGLTRPQREQRTVDFTAFVDAVRAVLLPASLHEVPLGRRAGWPGDGNG